MTWSTYLVSIISIVSFVILIFMKIKIFATGGTFDKEYNELTGELLFKDTHLQEILTLGKCKLDIDIRTLMLIDSLYMTQDDRYIIAEHCAHTPEEHIVVTHGTDTMVETAKVIAETVQDKTIVLTGAMMPFKMGASDALFNLGGAIAFVQSLVPGVYIAMNGKYFLWNTVKKNKNTGVFEEI